MRCANCSRSPVWKRHLGAFAALLKEKRSAVECSLDDRLAVSWQVTYQGRFFLGNGRGACRWLSHFFVESAEKFDRSLPVLQHGAHKFSFDARSASNFLIFLRMLDGGYIEKYLASPLAVLPLSLAGGCAVPAVGKLTPQEQQRRLRISLAACRSYEDSLE